MKPGILRKKWDDGEATATRTPEGWESNRPGFADLLGEAFPAPSTAAGTPWVMAFWAAAKGLGAEVVQEPEDDGLPPGAVA